MRVVPPILSPPVMAVRLATIALVVASVAQAQVPAQKPVPWTSIDPSDLARTVPEVVEDAPAEILLLDSKIVHSVARKAYSQRWTHVRIKIYTARGAEEHSTVVLPYGDGVEIQSVEGRTISPAGEIIPLKPEHIYDRVAAESQAVDRRTKTFTFPRVEPGCIIEYRWSESQEFEGAEFISLQRELPVRHLRYELRSARFRGAPAIWWHAFNTESPPRVSTPSGTLLFERRNILPYRREPFMPPDADVFPWLLLYYAYQPDLDAEKVWNDYAQELFKAFDKRLEVSREIRAAADSLAAEAANPEERLALVHEYCRNELANSDYGDKRRPLGDEEDEEHPADVRKPGEILEAGSGTSHEIRAVFAAMVRALGFSARLAALPDRREGSFDPHLPVPALLSDYAVAVDIEGRMEFFDPGTPYLGAGELHWWNEGVPALLADKKVGRFATTPLSAADESSTFLSGSFDLDEEGTLTGTMLMTMKGQRAVVWRRAWGSDPADWEDPFREMISERIGSAQTSHFEALSPNGLPVVCSVSLTVPGYGIVTGKRVFVRPSVFHPGKNPLPDGPRKLPLMFRYPWTERDSVAVHVPEGLTVAGEDSVVSFRMGPYGDYAFRLTIPSAHSILLERTFTLTKTEFTPSQYPQVQGAFSRMAEADGLSVYLER